MLSITHLIVAGAIAQRFPHPIGAPAAAFAAHFLMDAIPHWDFGTGWRNRSKSLTGALAVGETVLGFALSYLFFHNGVPTGIFAATLVASVLPDWLEAPWYMFFVSTKETLRKKPNQFFQKFFHWVYKTTNFAHTRSTFSVGILTQIATIIGVLLVLS